MGAADVVITGAAQDKLTTTVLGQMPNDTDPTTFLLYRVDGTPLGEGQQLIKGVLATGVAVRDAMVGYDRPDGARRWLSAS